MYICIKLELLKCFCCFFSDYKYKSIVFCYILMFDQYIYFIDLFFLLIYIFNFFNICDTPINEISKKITS